MFKIKKFFLFSKLQAKEFCMYFFSFPLFFILSCLASVARPPFSKIIENSNFRFEECKTALQTKKKIKELLPTRFTALTNSQDQDKYVGLLLNYLHDVCYKGQKVDTEIELLLASSYLSSTFFDVPALALGYPVISFSDKLQKAFEKLVQKKPEIEYGDIWKNRWRLPCNNQTLLLANMLEKSYEIGEEDNCLNWQHINKTPPEFKIKVLKNIFIILFLKKPQLTEIFVRNFTRVEQEHIFRALITQLRFSPVLYEKLDLTKTIFIKELKYGWRQKALLFIHRFAPVRKLGYASLLGGAYFFLESAKPIFFPGGDGMKRDMKIIAFSSFIFSSLCLLSRENTPVKELYI